MPDGSGLILGRSDNTATLGTSLLRTGSTEAIALFVENEFGGGIFGQGRGPDPFPLSPSTIGVRGRSVNGIGVRGSSDNSIGVYGQSNDASSASVWGHHSDGVGVYGSSNAIGVQGASSGN